MRILVFTGGLGNQIFEYAFYYHLKSVFKGESFYGNYGNKTKEHYGLEINKWFHVSLPPEKWWTNAILGVLYLFKKLQPKSGMFDLNQMEWKNKNARVYFPFKFNKAYVPTNNNWLRWRVDEKKLSPQNHDALDFIRNHKVCFIHVRRGDYLAARYKDLFEGCCTREYYSNAIRYMVSHVQNVRFVCFSDDIEWVRNELPVGENTLFVSWNTGTDSPLDMYLMSQCSYGIIANSTFSYWGARLGIEKDIVICPKRWWNSEVGNPQIFPENWIEL